MVNPASNCGKPLDPYMGSKLFFKMIVNFLLEGSEMNSQELKIYTALTHVEQPEDYRITDDGTKLYTLMDGGLVRFEGIDLDKMCPMQLYHWARSKMNDQRMSRW